MSGGFGGMIMDGLCSRHDFACKIWLTKQKPGLCCTRDFPA